MNIWTSLGHYKKEYALLHAHDRSHSTSSLFQSTPIEMMRAAVIAAPGEVQVEEIFLPEPGYGEVRVRLEGCGICASNLPVWEGKPWFDYPFEAGAPGHEGWGVVDALGPGVDRLAVGDRVTMLSYHAFAEYDIAKVEECVKLPSTLKNIDFPGEPLGCAMNVFARSRIEPGQTVAVVGIGFLGALLCSLAAHAGARVIAISRRQYALEIAKANGAEETIPMDDHWHIIDRIKQITRGQYCDTVIEAVGKQWPLDLAGEITKERGRLVVAGYHQDGPRQVNMQMWNWRGLDVINAHERDPKVYLQGIRSAVNAVIQGRINPAALYTHSYSLEQLPLALQQAHERPEGFMKALIHV